ncbi:MAG: thioredoxin family protein [Cyanobacteria bacterium]|nr:thioredoxin family protein [Cyanobacteria bacterium CG_2015-16_32_12]NCO78060.1 thioredoxin family protein [Cyanobacteria bacterium CG_2015-22_32_23]NCQ40939.1 thioredoxin family protein [Cyanobacteria bacterium CG_2015-04_32_10]NCS83729.1 thioredoxin family protein [Cyanobacteria bacterium CG_2015-02_32_10]
MLATRFYSALKRIFIIFFCTLTLWFSYSDVSRADINNDRYDGNIFVVYAGNGSLVPSKLTLKQSLDRKMPVILVYYLDDNSDSKQYAFIVSRFQEFYGRAASLIATTVDTIPPKDQYQPDELGYYYKGGIPQTVVLDQEGNVVFDQIGQSRFEDVDDVLRKVFDLLPRSESVELKRKTFNEFNSELVPVNK